MIIAIPSNRPQRMRSCLLNVLDANELEKPAKAVIVVDDSGADNLPALTEIAKDYTTPVHYARNDYSPKWLFQSFGGVRNACLAQAIRYKEDVLMLDDDVVPVEDCLSLHAEYLKTHAIVVGGVQGRQTGVGFLLKTINQALAAFEQGEDREKAIQIIKSALSGMSLEDYCDKYNGANLSVRKDVARAVCFLPSSLRIEDGLFCQTAKYLVKEEAFVPEKQPVVYHNPLPRSTSFLSKAWEDSVKGAAACLAIQYAFEHNTPVEVSAEKGPAELLKQFDSPAFEQRREKQKHYDDLIKLIGDAEIEREYFKVAEYREKPRKEFILEQMQLYRETLEAWQRFKPQPRP